MKVLNKKEIRIVSGGFWPEIWRAVLPTVVAIAVNAFKKNDKNQEGLSKKIVSGSIALEANTAAGGGFVANIAWAPDSASINITANTVNKNGL